MISIDILTPFIDLLEDAMLGQVPPMVVSPFRAPPGVWLIDPPVIGPVD